MRRLLLTLVLLPILGAAHGATTLTLNEAEALWRELSRELRLAQAALGGAVADLRAAGQIALFVLPALYLYVARHPRLAKALH